MIQNNEIASDRQASEAFCDFMIHNAGPAPAMLRPSWRLQFRLSRTPELYEADKDLTVIAVEPEPTKGSLTKICNPPDAKKTVYDSDVKHLVEFQRSPRSDRRPA